MSKWPVEQGWDFAVGLLGKAEGNKGSAWSLECPGSLIPHQILCPYRVVEQPALSWSLDKYAFTSK